MPETLSREDLLRAQIGLSLDTPAKRAAYMELLVDKWGGAGWLNADMARSDQAKKFHERLLKMRCRELDSSDYRLGSMAMILENQRQFQAQHEHTITGSVEGNKVRFTLAQDTTTADEALPTREVMPIIRRIYAVVLNNDISRVQPMAGPSSYVFWLDFIREVDSTNLLSIEYNQLLTPELGVPTKGKLKLVQRQINAVKQMLGVTWSTEAEEDARALLNLNIESELMREFGNEFVRDLFARHINTILLAAQGSYDPSIGTSLPGVWANHLATVQMPNKGSLGTPTLTEYKQAVYATLLDADAAFLRANRRPASKLLCGYGMAAFLQKLNTATGSESPSGEEDMSSVGFSNYGQYAARFQIVGTEFVPDNMALLYTPNPDALHAGHVYAPYVPVQASPKVYAGYNSSTGVFTNTDEWTRTLRERSAEVVTKPYSFQLILGPSGGLAQWT